MRSAIGLWVHSDWRRRRVALAALTLLTGLAFGVVATAFAGARRTASSFDRLRAATRAYDHGIAIDAPGAHPGRPELDRYDNATVRRLRALPEVRAAGGLTTFVASLPDADWEFALNAVEDDVVGHLIEHARILRGREPDPQRANEVLVNEATVDQARVDVGASVHLTTLSPTQRLRVIAGDEHAFDHGPLGPALDLKIVGVYRGTTDVLGRPDPTIIATPAFDQRYRRQVAYSSRILLVRRAPHTTAAEFHAAVNRAVSRETLGVFDATTEDKSARQTTTTLSVGLVAFAIVAALASILAIGQMAARHIAGASPDQLTLTSLGFTRAQRIRGLVGTIAPTAVFGTLIAVLGSIAASSLMPVGLARRIEPDPGLRFDPLVIAAVAAAMIGIIVAAALLVAIPLTRTGGRQRPQRASGVATSLGAAGAGPVVTTGVRLAFDRRPPALPVRSALLGVGATITVLVAALTFSASLSRLEREPRRWGFGWDLMLDTNNTGIDSMTRDLATDHDLAGVSLLSTNFTFMGDGNGIRAYGLARVSGSIGYALRSGTQPVGPDEVVIGPETAHTLHLRVGDTAQIAVCPCTGDPAHTTMGPVRVVGTALFPEGDEGNFTNALGLSGSGFERHVGQVDTPRAAVRLASGRRLQPVADDLRRRYPAQLSQYSYPTRPGEVANLVGVRSFPRALAGFTAFLGIAALANILVTTLRRRRREFATLRSIGLTPAQTGGCIVWQCASLTALALAIGIPVGIVTGAGAWAAATHGIGVATDASHPLIAVALFSVAAFVAALAISVPAGWRAARLGLADALRSE